MKWIIDHKPICGVAEMTNKLEVCVKRASQKKLTNEIGFEMTSFKPEMAYKRA
jgi:hypothetical protein